MLWRLRFSGPTSVRQVGFQGSSHAAYRREVDAIAGHFQGYQVEHIDSGKNEAADALSRLGSQRKPVSPNTFLDILHNPSVKVPTEEDLAVPDPEAQLVAALHIIPDWTVPYLAYMSREIFLRMKLWPGK